MRSAADDRTAIARIRDAAIQQWGQHGLDIGLRRIAAAAGVSAALVIHHFGSKDGLRKVCDDFIGAQIRTGKAAPLRTIDPADWLRQMAEIQMSAPMMAYLVRSMQSGGELSKMLWRQMIDDAEYSLEGGVKVGLIKRSRDPRARARYIAMSSGGGFLMYLQMHDNPTDIYAVLRDYSEEMTPPALDIYTQGLMVDSTMYEAFLAKHTCADWRRGTSLRAGRNGRVDVAAT